MNKVIDSSSKAVADVGNESTVAIAGFGPMHCWPRDLITSLGKKGSTNLTIVSTSVGEPGELSPHHLIENGQVKKMIASFTNRTGMKAKSEELILAGLAKGELVPQGILAERCRAGGAGIPAFYSPTGVGTALSEGKDIRYFGGSPYVLEEAIHADFAFLRAWRADHAGNVEFRGSTQNLNVSFAKAARVAIVEVDEVVETGVIPPERIHLPGIFISRVIKSRLPDPALKGRGGNRRARDSARTYNGKPGLTRNVIAKRAAALIKEGSYINLGTGIPLHVCNYLDGRDVMLHSENGLLGYGGAAAGEAINPNVYSAGAQFVSLIPGASFFDSVTSFEMARGGHLDTVILGAYQVDESANLANWSTAEKAVPGLGGIGGAMDLVASKAELIVVMEHMDSKGNRKLLRKCTLPLTAPKRVNWVITDLCLFQWNGNRFVLRELAPGFSIDEIRSLTEMGFEVADTVRPMA